MAYSVNWATKVITIPYADTVLVSGVPDVRSLDATTLWETLRDIEDSEEGMVYDQIVRNTTPLTVAGVTLARVVEIINGYTITFEDGLYAVNIGGGNTNLADVVNKNSVSVNTANSAGLVNVLGGSGDPWSTVVPGSYPAGSAGYQLGNLPAAVANVDSDVAALAAQVTDIPADVFDIPVESGITLRQAMRVMLAAMAGKASGAATATNRFRNPGDTKDRIVSTVDADGNRTSVVLDTSD